MRRILQCLGSIVTKSEVQTPSCTEGWQPLRRGLSSFTSQGPSTSSGSAPRRVPQRSRPDAATTAEAAESTGASIGASGSSTPTLLAEMKEVPGGSKPMYSWERWYWGIGVGGVSIWLFWRLKPESKTQEQIEVRRAFAGC